MRYFHYGSGQTDAVRDTHHIVEVKGVGGNKLGALEKKVGSAREGVRADISSVQTTIEQGTWGGIPKRKYPSPTENEDTKPGKAAGLLCVDQRGSGSETKTYWYQIGVDSNGKAFAELGWKTWWGAGSILKKYDHSVTKNTILKMVPKGNTVEFHFGSHVKDLTWDPESDDWNRKPNFRLKKDNYWNDMNKIVSIRLQIEAYWSSSLVSEMELPGTEQYPFIFGPTEYESPKKGSKTIPAREFKRLSDESSFKSKKIGDKVKMWSSQNREPEEQN